MAAIVEKKIEKKREKIKKKVLGPEKNDIYVFITVDGKRQPYGVCVKMSSNDRCRTTASQSLVSGQLGNVRAVIRCDHATRPISREQPSCPLPGQLDRSFQILIMYKARPFWITELQKATKIRAQWIRYGNRTLSILQVKPFQPAKNLQCLQEANSPWSLRLW